MNKYAAFNARRAARGRHNVRVHAAAKAQAFRDLVQRISSGDQFTARNRVRDAAKAGMRIVDVVRFECEHDNGDTSTAYRDYLIGEATAPVTFDEDEASRQAAEAAYERSLRQSIG